MARADVEDLCGAHQAYRHLGTWQIIAQLADATCVDKEIGLSASSIWTTYWETPGRCATFLATDAEHSVDHGKAWCENHKSFTIGEYMASVPQVTDWVLPSYVSAGE